MKKCMAVLALTGAFALAGSAEAARPNSMPLAHGCKIGSQGYISSHGKCYHLPKSGKPFTVKAPGTSTPLQGVGTAETSGHDIALTQVAAPIANPQGDWIRVQSDGSFPPLTAQGATIYQYIPRTGRLIKVKAITKPGIYVIVANT